MIGGALLLAILAGDPMPEMPALTNLGTLPIAFIYILLLGGPLQEEFGWRGFLLDRLQNKMSAVLSSMTVGVVWGL